MVFHIVIGSIDESLTAFRLRQVDAWPGDTVMVLGPLFTTERSTKEYVVDREGKLRPKEAN